MIFNCFLDVPVYMYIYKIHDCKQRSLMKYIFNEIIFRYTPYQNMDVTYTKMYFKMYFRGKKIHFQSCGILHLS